jgi:hypothetical protein
VYTAYATVQADIFKPTKFGGKYTVTLIPGMLLQDKAEIPAGAYVDLQVMVLVPKSPSP